MSSHRPHVVSINSIYRQGPSIHENPHCPVNVMRALSRAWREGNLPSTKEVFPCKTCDDLRAQAGTLDLPSLWAREPRLPEAEVLLTASSELVLLHVNRVAFLRQVDRVQELLTKLAHAVKLDSRVDNGPVAELLDEIMQEINHVMEVNRTVTLKDIC